MPTYAELATAATNAAQAVNDFAAQNSGYCTMVGFTAVVHNFKNAWNAAWSAPDAPSPGQAQLAHNGMYDDACAGAIASLLGSAQGTCPNPLPSQEQPPPPPPPPPPKIVKKGGVPKWAWVLVGVLALLAVGGLGWYLYRRFGPTRALPAGEKRRKGKRKT